VISTGYSKWDCWQANCLKDEHEILVALERNDAYALKHQSWARWTVCAFNPNQKR
jgi:hypothetical protein